MPTPHPKSRTVIPGPASFLDRAVRAMDAAFDTRMQEFLLVLV
jgi:hypothetical protein